tara:strand:+ start:5963 stop:6301 length:339 start_codon:yes stop_codon:yes gene_type:complete
MINFRVWNYIYLIFNLFSIVNSNIYNNPVFKKSSSCSDLLLLKKSSNFPDLLLSKKSNKFKLYRTDYSYMYHLIKDENYLIPNILTYKQINTLYNPRHPSFQKISYNDTLLR